MKQYEAIYGPVRAPQPDCTGKPHLLSDATMAERKRNILRRMDEEGFDVLAVYCDVEHSGNFEYLTGFFTRFEEGMLVLRRSGEAVLLLGNENLNKADKTRIPCRAVHVPYFSLPNQPMENTGDFLHTIQNCGIRNGDRVGIAGWKLFTSRHDDNKELFEVPYFIVHAIRELAGKNGTVRNATAVFIGENGVRTVNNADELAHYEYGASLASDAVLNAMDLLEEGITETELGNALVRDGQHCSVVTIAASGERFVKANMYPTDNRVKRGDPVSLTVGYKGGLSSRTGYAVSKEEELPAELQDYIPRVVMPYYRAYAMWLSEIRIGMTGGELFEKMDAILPRKEYHWSLCPGHLTADEEWLSSPVYEGSKEVLRSGMLFQIDILPSVKGYGGTNAESTAALADEALRARIREEEPELWERIIRRRVYIREELHIDLSEDVLPMCSGVGFLRPFLLDKTRAMRLK